MDEIAGLSYMSKWHKELEIFYKLKSLIILEGNILDIYAYPGMGVEMPLPQYLHHFFADREYENIVRFDPLEGFCPMPGTEERTLARFAKSCGSDVERLNVPFASAEGSGAVLTRNAMVQNQVSTAVIMDMASRYMPSPEHLSQAQVDAYTALLQGGQQARRVRSHRMAVLNLNILIMIVNKLNDVPAWFYLDNPFVKTIHLTTPSREERENMMKEEYFPVFFDKELFQEDMELYRDRTDELVKIQERFVGITEGFTKIELQNLCRLCKDEKYHIHELTDVVDLYRYGIRENPWSGIRLRKMLQSGTTVLHDRVLGQPAALERTLGVIKRAAAGMSGLQHSSHTKPKGILFFAGPTGTGKTEMAKSLAELLFGDESRCIRFDMSEYAAGHSDQKLLGAPPGYVGYEAGGQLTNAVRENPFSILLFDEIEKAHGSILDKFLQILEDGRMTDGQGKTVYFSESVIIFTSNLGIYRRRPDGSRTLNVNADETYEEVEAKVREAVESYFKLELGRPELLNRIGENIIVFDFIRPEAAKKILDKQLRSIVRKLQDDNRVFIKLSDSAREVLYQKVVQNLHNGGRGIGNVVEKLLLTPLASYMIDYNCLQDAYLEIISIEADSTPVKLGIERMER